MTLCLDCLAKQVRADVLPADAPQRRGSLHECPAGESDPGIWHHGDGSLRARHHDSCSERGRYKSSLGQVGRRKEVVVLGLVDKAALSGQDVKWLAILGRM